MGGGLESRFVSSVYGADGAVRRHGIVCCNSKSNAPEDGPIYPKHVELIIHQ